MIFGYLFYTEDKSVDPNGLCRNLISLIQRHGLDKMINYRSIDNMNTEQLAQLKFESVPTLIIIFDNGQNKTQQVFEGEDAFKWVQNFLITRRQSSIKNAEMSRKLIQNSNTKDKLTDGIFEFNQNEHMGISDTYAFCNVSDDQNKNFRQGKMFNNNFSTNDDNLGAIPIAGKNINEYKKKEGLSALYGNDENVKKAVSQIENARKAQDEQMNKVVEKNIIGSVIRSDA